MALDIIQGLWIGGALSRMEQMSINSYLRNGHEFHLYTYGNVDLVPPGAVVKDANEIIPQGDVFQNRGGYSTFSDFFRWKLVLDRGGWWSDLDAICLKPFDFPSEYVFVGGLGPVGSDDCVSSGMFKAPAGSPILSWGWEQCQKMDTKTMAWGQAGPPLFTEAVHKFGLTSSIVPGKLFFPVFYTLAPKVFTSKYSPIYMGDCYSIHLFNEMWRLAEVNKNWNFDPTCLYEQLKRRFL